MSIKDVVITGILMGVSACLGMLCVLTQSDPEILAQQVHNILPLASFCMTAAFAALFIQDVSNRDALEFRSYWGGLGGGVGGFTVSPGVVYALLTLVFSGITLWQVSPKVAEPLPVPEATPPTTLPMALPDEAVLQQSIGYVQK